MSWLRYRWHRLLVRLGLRREPTFAEAMELWRKGVVDMYLPELPALRFDQFGDKKTREL